MHLHDLSVMQIPGRISSSELSIFKLIFVDCLEWWFSPPIKHRVKYYFGGKHQQGRIYIFNHHYLSSLYAKLFVEYNCSQFWRCNHHSRCQHTLQSCTNNTWKRMMKYNSNIPTKEHETKSAQKVTNEYQLSALVLHNGNPILVLQFCTKTGAKIVSFNEITDRPTSWAFNMIYTMVVMAQSCTGS